jgi:hypothetical protein
VACIVALIDVSGAVGTELVRYGMAAGSVPRLRAPAFLARTVPMVTTFGRSGVWSMS